MRLQALSGDHMPKRITYLIATDMGPHPVEGVSWPCYVGAYRIPLFLHWHAEHGPKLSHAASGLQVTALRRWMRPGVSEDNEKAVARAAQDAMEHFVEKYGADHMLRVFRETTPVSRGEEFI
jgi:hypothetical protein